MVGGGSGYYKFIPHQEHILKKGSKVYISSNGRRPSDVDDNERDLRQMQKEFASEIYIQRCLEFGR